MMVFVFHGNQVAGYGHIEVSFVTCLQCALNADWEQYKDLHVKKVRLTCCSKEVLMRKL